VLLLEALRHIKNPRFQAVIFRRTYPQILQPEGLWETSTKVYPYAGASGSQGNLLWKFPSGARVSFSHMENESDKEAWLGAGIPLIGFDELVTFSSQQFFFLLGSNRSTCGVKPYIRCTTNPDSKSWVAQFIQWWWDPETGYPIDSRAGKLRWFIRVNDSIIWADTSKELEDEYPGYMPLSVTFIPSKVYDNKILLQKDPGYLAKLMALSKVDKERYLGGNWKISEGGGKMFKREWFRIIPERPASLRTFVRFWDVASTEPNKKNKEPDWTCGVLMSLKDGVYYVLDVQRFRGTPKVVEQRILQVAQTDPYGTKIRMEEEGGASGKVMTDHYARYVLVGYNFKGIKSIKDKVTRAGAFSSAAEAGNVVLIRNPLWNMSYLDELENFEGLEEKNDQCLAAGTLVECEHGQIPIERIKPGDMVWTRRGLRRVLWSGMTNSSAKVFELTTSNARLIGTGSHPVFENSFGFVRLDSLNGSHSILEWQKLRSNGGTETGIGATQIQNTDRIGFIFRGWHQLQKACASTTSIVTCGLKRMALFPQATKFTIKTEIPQKIATAIFAALHLRNTENWMVSLENLAPRMLRPILQGSGTLQLDGILLGKGLNGTAGMARKVGRKESSGQLNVCFAKNDLKPEITEGSIFAHRFATTEVDTREPKKTHQPSAPFVEETSLPAVVARSPVVTVCVLEDLMPVYNISVEECNEYFANGILVHNCDASSGAQIELAGTTGAWKYAEAVATSSRPLALAAGTGQYTPMGR